MRIRVHVPEENKNDRYGKLLSANVIFRTGIKKMSAGRYITMATASRIGRN